MKKRNIIYYLIPILASGIIIAGCGGNGNTIAKFENEAEIQYNSGNLDEALNSINQAEGLGQLSERGSELKGFILIDKAKKCFEAGEYKDAIEYIENADNLFGEANAEGRELLYQTYGELIEDIYLSNKDSSDIDPEELITGVDFLREQIKIYPDKIDTATYVFFKKNYGLYLEENDMYAELVNSLKEDILVVWKYDLSEVNLPNYTQYDSIDKYVEAFTEFNKERFKGDYKNAAVINNIIWNYEACQYAFESSQYGIKDALVGDHIRFSEEDIINLINNPYIDEELSFLYDFYDYGYDYDYMTNYDSISERKKDFSNIDLFYNFVINPSFQYLTVNPSATELDSTSYDELCYNTWTVLEKDDQKALLLYDLPVDEESLFGFYPYSENEVEEEKLTKGGYLNTGIPVRVLTYEEYAKYADIINYTVFDYRYKNSKKSWFMPENTSYETDIYKFKKEVPIHEPGSPNVVIGYRDADYKREIMKAKILDVKTGLVQDFDGASLLEKNDGLDHGWEYYIHDELSKMDNYRVAAWFYY